MVMLRDRAVAGECRGCYSPRTEMAAELHEQSTPTY